VHGFFEVDRVQNFDPVPVALEQLPGIDDDISFRVLSIRIEKKVTYFSEVTVSD
jgi:hypothetical protein